MDLRNEKEEENYINNDNVLQLQFNNGLQLDNDKELQIQSRRNTMCCKINVESAFWRFEVSWN